MGLSTSVALFFALCAQTPAATTPNSCVACHAEIAKLEAGRAHAQAEIGCVACHGGDSAQAEKDAAHAASAGFSGKLGALATVELCGNCHADVARMNPYGLPTDQLAQYRTSRHGQGLFTDHDESGAICSSCHGAHGILGPKSSESPVHPTHVAQTCGKCHGDESLMTAHGLAATAPAAYAKSVHAQVLAKGDDSAPQCATCHGSHGAIPPGFGSVAAVCGKCHMREKELFQKSPHAPLVETGDFPGCIVCHSNHAIQPAEPRIFESVCGLCHGGTPEVLAKRDRIAGALNSSNELLAAREAELQAAAQHGLASDEDELFLDEARTGLKSARVLQHSLDPARVEEVTGEARGQLEALRLRLQKERDAQRWKRLALLPVVAFLILMSLGAWVRFRRLHSHA
ncbi:MAG: cytochrome c3 family protein [Planctomycetes bacterium]|nr:cytochrome c3 family protein [Planctomycetota bacterium]